MNELSPYRDHGAAAALRPAIELVDIRKTFVTDGGVHVDALRGVSLSIGAGEFVAIMGQSGSGKTTLMNLIGCLDKPTSGQYLFAGEDVSGFDADELAWLRREAFGFVFQTYNLLSNATALENVEVPAVYAGMPHHERAARAAELLKRFGLGERMDHRPSQLSGGQQQRVSIARALMNGGRIILADEPTGALDTKSGAEVMAQLHALADAGHTVVLITHDPNVAKQARRMVEIRDGEIVSDSGLVLRGPARTRVAPQDDESNVPRHAEVRALRTAHSEPRSTLLLSESLRMAMRALRANVFRTILTLLGIVIGVGSVVSMLAIGEGARQQVLQQIGSMGTNLLLVRPGVPGQRGVGGNVTTLVPDDVAAIKTLPNIDYALPENQGPVTARLGDQDYQTTADATSPDLPDTRSWPVARGTFFTEEDERSYAPVAVLGQTVVDNLLPDGGDPIGQYILIKNVPFQVIGVMSQKGATSYGQDADDVIFVPLSTGSLRLFGQNFLRSITVAVADVSEIDATQDAVDKLLTARHGGEDFRIRNMTEVMETASAAQNTMTILLGSVAAISLLVGGIGIMNIMLVSVTERTREIGIRMATGARQRDILRQFLSEAVVVSGIGGLVGIAGGVAAGLAIQAFGTPVTFTAAPMLLAFGCAAATGLVFGYAPARKAARLDPVVALASE